MRILYVCNDLGYWAAHRADLARRMQEAGATVMLVTGAGGAGAPLASLGPAGGGMQVRALSLPTQRLAPRQDAGLMAAVLGAVRDHRPDVVHLITLKPILFGAAALRLPMRSPPRVVASFAGLGRVFASDDRRQRLVTRGLRFALGTGRAVAVFENDVDRARSVAAGIVPAHRSAVVRGAGFEPADYPAAPLPPGPEAGQPLRCLLAARMLRAKGVEAVIDAAVRLRAAQLPVEITLAGPTGEDAEAVPAAVLQAAADRGDVRWLGAVPAAEMAAVLARHHVGLLPSTYPEGTPRILAEAGSVGRMSIVSANPGCTTFVRDGVEGLVIDPPDGERLAAAIAGLVRAPAQIAAMGAAARRRALRDGFTAADVAADYARLYLGEALPDRRD